MSLSVEEKGAQNPTTVVLVHGAGVAGWMWKQKWESLADFHCLMVDLPDHGPASVSSRVCPVKLVTRT